MRLDFFGTQLEDAVEFRARIRAQRAPDSRCLLELIARRSKRTAAHVFDRFLVDRDYPGTRAGFDCELTAAVSAAVNIPVIASGGAGTPEHFVEVFGAGRADVYAAEKDTYWGGEELWVNQGVQTRIDPDKQLDLENPLDARRLSVVYSLITESGKPRRHGRPVDV